MYDLLIKDALIVLPDEIVAGSVAIKDEKISAIIKDDTVPEAKEILDIEGKYLFPGIIDAHVHFNEPGFTWREDFEHGSKAAALGGVTMIVDMPMLNKPAVADAEVFRRKHKLISHKAAIDYGFWGALVDYNFKALPELNEAGALAYKCFMCPVQEDYTSLNVKEIERVLDSLKSFQGTAGFHCEDFQMIAALEQEKLVANQTSRKDYLLSRPVEAELKAVKEIIEIAEKKQAKIHICHVSHPIVAQKIKEAKQKGVNITAETSVHYLIFSEEDLLQKGALYKCSPPLRKKEDAEALWEYVCDGTLDYICSDHSPATLEEKDEKKNGFFGTWGGISGVQTSLQLFYHHAVNKRKLSPAIIAKTMALRPAQVMDVYGLKGEIKSGFDADFVVLDPKKEWEITEQSLAYQNKISAFIGQKGKGGPVCTIVRGKIVVQEDVFKHKECFGKLIKKYL